MNSKTKKILQKVCKITLLVSSIILIGYLGFLVYLSIAFKPQNVVVTNITDGSATVTWTTTSPMKGIVYVKKDKALLPGPLGIIGSGIAYDDRDVSDAQKACVDAFNKKASETKDSTFSVSGSNFDCENVKVAKAGSYYTHSVTMTNLDEKSTYNFVVGDGIWSFEENVSTVKTFSVLESITEPKPIFGKVVGEDDSVSKDGLVYITFNDGSESKDSIVYSSTTNDDGGWYVDASSVRDVNGNILPLELSNDSFKAKGVYKNYGSSEEEMWVWGYFNDAYPDIVVKDMSKEKALILSAFAKELTCGDGSCSGGETSSSCPKDCRPTTSSYCGDGKCNGSETPLGCSVDCKVNIPTATICGDKKCTGSETFASCSTDCKSAVSTYCGDGKCNGSENANSCSKDCPSTSGNSNSSGGSSSSGSSSQVVLPSYISQAQVDVILAGSLSTATAAEKAKAAEMAKKIGYGNAQKILDGASVADPLNVLGLGNNSGNTNALGLGTGSGIPICDYSHIGYCAKTGTNSSQECLSDRWVKWNNSIDCGLTTGTTAGAEIKCDALHYDFCEKTEGNNSRRCGVDGKWIESKNSIDCGIVRTCDGFSSNYCQKIDNNNSRLCNFGKWARFSSGDCGKTQTTSSGTVIKDQGMGTIKCDKATQQCVIDMGNGQTTTIPLDTNRYQSLGFSTSEQLYTGNIVIFAEEFDYATLFRLGATGIKDLISGNEYVKDIVATELQVLKSTAGSSSHDIVNLCNAIGEQTAECKNACTGINGTIGSSGECIHSSSSIRNLFNASKVFAADETTDSYALYMPEYGMYNFQLGNSTVSTNVADGKTIYLFYVEANKKEGFQIPVDFEHPTSEEDIVLSSGAYKITYTKESTAQQYEIKKGINIVSFNFIPTSTESGSYTAKDMIFQASDNGVEIQYISTFEGGRWNSGYSCSSGTCIGNNFTIVPGKGYLIYSTQSGTVTVPGYNLTSSVPVAFSAGWNLVGVHGYTTAYTARSFIDSVNRVDGLTANNVSWWPTAKSKYEGLQVDSGTEYGLDFPINSTNGYFVRISKFTTTDTKCKSLIWNEGGSLNGTCGNTK